MTINKVIDYSKNLSQQKNHLLVEFVNQKNIIEIVESFCGWKIFKAAEHETNHIKYYPIKHYIDAN